jgi:hypothetical protein
MLADQAYEQVREVKRRYTSYLLTFKNVVGVGVNKKRRRGVEIPIYSVTVYVKKKLPDLQLDPADIIPTELDGVPTDVVEIGEPLAYPS